MKDLFVLVADLDQQNLMQGLLPRYHSLGIREISFTIERHLEHDSGCYRHCDSFTRLYQRTHSHALVLFDKHGCGCDDMSRIEIELDCDGRLQKCGWGENATTVVVEPEIEMWMWTSSSSAAQEMGWDNYNQLVDFVQNQGLWNTHAYKPSNPKDAFRKALSYQHRKPLAPIFKHIAEKSNFSRCQDPAFAKLLATLQRWFPIV